MRGTKAKAVRRERVARELPAFKTPVHNFTDLEDNRADRRLKKFRKKEYERQLKESSPARNRAHRSRWLGVFFWLTLPDYRDALDNPCKKKPKNSDIASDITREKAGAAA